MIITRTPFRVTLGGGGTDLPSYYEKYGGFIFSFALDKYMYISVNRPVVDELIRLKYNRSETVAKLADINHDIAKACLNKMNIFNSIEITSTADIPSGCGLGSSSTYTVGLLSALHTLKRDYISLHELAEDACEIEMDILKRPMGKQDQYLAAFGGFTAACQARQAGRCCHRHPTFPCGSEDFCGVEWRVSRGTFGDQLWARLRHQPGV